MKMFTTIIGLFQKEGDNEDFPSQIIPPMFEIQGETKSEMEEYFLESFRYVYRQTADRLQWLMTKNENATGGKRVLHIYSSLIGYTPVKESTDDIGLKKVHCAPIFKIKGSNQNDMEEHILEVFNRIYTEVNKLSGVTENNNSDADTSKVWKRGLTLL